MYIIPTRYGAMYAAGSILCVFCAIIYSNNLAYLLCFFIISIFVIGLHQSNNNLKKINFEKIDINLIPSNSNGFGTVWLKSKNSSGHVRVDIKGRFLQKKEILEGHIELFSAKSMTASRVKIYTKGRGEKILNRITLSSRYPFGLFYVWRHFNINQKIIVYPEPKGLMELPQALSDGSVELNSNYSHGDDFKGHKLYEYGDSPKKIDWKAYARGRELLTKEFEEGDNGFVPISIKKLTGSLEQNLKQCSQWIFECEKRNLQYSLELENITLVNGNGTLHKNKSLIELAVHK